MNFHHLRKQLRHHLIQLNDTTETQILTRKGLQSLLLDTQRYDTLCLMHSPFRSHFMQTISKYQLNTEDVFMLLEDLLIFIRETALRSGARALPSEARLLQWTELQHEWTLGDGTLFSDYYYILIPSRVLHDMTLTPLRHTSPVQDCHFSAHPLYAMYPHV